MASAAPLMQKATARVALINLDEFTSATFRDCFSQFGIRVVPLEIDTPERLEEEKYEACAIGVDERAIPFLEAVRNSPLNSRIVIYGVCIAPHTGQLFTRYGINAALEFPLDRQAALRVVRASRLLLLNEFRRYVRVPITVEVSLTTGTRTSEALSEEISAGGMSLRVSIPPPAKTSLVLLSFSLPGTSKASLTGRVCWVAEGENRIGVRFGDDRGRYLVRNWIENFLRIA